MPQRHAAKIVTLTLRYWWLQLVGAALTLIGFVVVLAGAAKRLPLHLTLGKLTLPTNTTGLVLFLVGVVLLVAPVLLLRWLGGKHDLETLTLTYATTLSTARATTTQVSTQAVTHVRKLATSVRAAIPSR